MTARVLIAVTHLMGSGHLVRSLALARALGAAGTEVLVLSGGRPLPHLESSGVQLRQLAPVAATGLDYRALQDSTGRPVTAAWMAERLDLALATLRDFAPDVLVTETWPFGRGALWAEYAALAGATPAHRVVSVRDIPEPPATAAKAARAEAALDGVAAVLVHGDPAVSRFTDHWPLGPAAAGLLHYTGFVSEPMPLPLPSDEVLVAVGGGGIGRGLLQAAAGAAALSRRPWRLLAGGADAAEAAAALPGPARAEPARADYRARLAGAAASVSLSGYNTTCDLMRCTTPAVLVPMAEAGEREQGLRAAALARFGFGRIDPERLTPETLHAAVEAAIAAGPRTLPRMDLDGAAQSAALLMRIAGRTR